MSQSKLLECSGSVENIVYHNDSNQYTVLEMNTGEDLITVVGAFPYVSVGEDLKVFGKWSSHATFGEQFKAEAFERTRPETVSAVLKYLASGAVKGIGPAMANRIVTEFGSSTLDVLENDPERLSQVKGISKEKAFNISQEIKRVNGIRDLMVFLSTFGVRPEDAVLVWKVYGDASISCIQEDPYCICEEGIEISFDIADMIAQSLDREADNLDRVKAGAKHVLRHNLNNGHTCLPREKFTPIVSKMLGASPETVQDAIYELIKEQELIAEYIGENEFLFLPKQYDSERYIAERLKLMLKYPPQKMVGVDDEIESIESSQGLKYADAQKEAIRAALEKGILILTGGPGTGKTTTLNAIIHILKQRGESVLLAAPTGRAAKRMSDLTGEEAKTIHRMLKVEWDEHDKPVFQKNERDPLDCDCIVIDELSMVDSYMFESVLRALPLSCRMIFVGDSDQLPSVGAGSVLGDLIASKMFSTVQLKEIFRQSMESLIVVNAHKIVDGKMPDLDVRDNDFFFMPSPDKQTASELIVSLCSSRLPKSYGYSPVNDIQILCPGRKTELGTVELNQKLRNAINPESKDKREVKINGNLFRTGDKVMQIKNDYNLIWEKEDGTAGEGVFNGDMGTITYIDKAAGVMSVSIDGRDVVYDFEHAAAELELAYAVTVHKSQGNEFSAVVMPVLDTMSMLCYRNLFYTAITRAKELLILVGNRRTIAAMVENDRKTRRYTALAHFLTTDEAF